MARAAECGLMSLESVPPSRYRIEQRGRRLVTIDTKTGQQAGLMPPPAGRDPLEGIAAKPVGPKQPLNFGAPARPPLAKLAVSNQGKPLKLMALVLLASMAALVLIVTSLWIPVIIALLIPQVRAALGPPVKAAFARFMASG
jgi:hypothetical protein